MTFTTASQLPCPPQVRQEDWRNLELGISLPHQVCWALIRPQQARLWLNSFRRAGIVKKYRVPRRLSKWFLSPSMPGAPRGIFSDLHCEHLAGLREVTSQNCTHGRGPGVFNSQALSPHSSLSVYYSYPSSGSSGCFCSWASASLYTFLSVSLILGAVVYAL